MTPKKELLIYLLYTIVSEYNSRRGRRDSTLDDKEYAAEISKQIKELSGALLALD